MKDVTFIIQKAEKLEDFLNSFYISKSNMYKLNTNKSFQANGDFVDLNYILKKGDLLVINTECLKLNDIIPWKYDLKIIYEDQDIIVINKPSGVLVHPDGNSNKTLVNAIKYYYDNNNKDYDIRVVHRLDVDTSGLIVFANNIFSHSFLSRQMEDKAFDKTYVAIIEGKLDKESGTIDLPIAKDRHNNNKFIVNSNGKQSVTHFTVLKELIDKTIVQINLETGRTHQIRVHFSHINHSLVGDNIYGKSNKRLMLHSKKISFLHPRTKKQINFETKLPKEFNL